MTDLWMWLPASAILIGFVGTVLVLQPSVIQRFRSLAWFVVGLNVVFMFCNTLILLRMWLL